MLGRISVHVRLCFQPVGGQSLVSNDDCNVVCTGCPLTHHKTGTMMASHAVRAGSTLTSMLRGYMNPGGYIHHVAYGHGPAPRCLHLQDDIVAAADMLGQATAEVAVLEKQI